MVDGGTLAAMTDRLPSIDPPSVRALEGVWKIERAVWDHLRGLRGHFHGTATILPDGGGYDWDERGRLSMGDFEGDSGRRLRIVPAEDGGWEVCFADGRPFHRLDLSGGDCHPVHLCGADTYRGHYALRGPDRMRIVWRVRGPAKDLELVGDYRRAATDTR